jgi:3-Oxoacyl-[acyl-carrier-protein (ACP)] synthase III C terminal
VVSNLAEYGNTSAASIPLALDEAVRRGQIKAGDTVSSLDDIEEYRFCGMSLWQTLWFNISRILAMLCVHQGLVVPLQLFCEDIRGEGLSSLHAGNL